MQVQVPTVQTMGNITSAQRGFSIKSGSFAFDLLSSGMYTRPIEAVVREVICNAIDAHVDAGNTSPVKVQLPNDEHSDFVVEDEGTGMAFDVLERLMTTYFDSTKRDTNNQIGGFGIGSKAPFAYTDTFNIRARWNGVQRFYVAYKETDGPVLRQIGDEVHTTERNGIRVSFPVRDSDFKKFEDVFATVALYLPKGSVESGSPILHYSDYLYEVIPGVWREKEGTGLDVQITCSHAFRNKVITHNGGSLFVCMGGVHYSVATSVARRAARLGIRLIVVPVGALTPHPSREMLAPDADSENLLTTFVDATQTVLTDSLVAIMNSKSASLFAKQVANTQYSAFTGVYFENFVSVFAKASEIMSASCFAKWQITRCNLLDRANKKRLDWSQQNRMGNLPASSTVVVTGSASVNSKTLEFNDLRDGVIFFVQKKDPLYTQPNGIRRFVPWSSNKERDEAVESAILFLNEQFSLTEDATKARNYHTLPKIPRVKLVDGKGAHVTMRRPVMAKNLMNGQADVEVPDEVPCLYVITANKVPQCDACKSIGEISHLLQEDIMHTHLTKRYGADVMVVLVPISIHKKFVKRSGKSVPLQDYMKQLISEEGANIKDYISKAEEMARMKEQSLPNITRNFLEEKDSNLLDIEAANPHISLDKDYGRFTKLMRSAFRTTSIWRLPESSSARALSSASCIKAWEEIHDWWYEKAAHVASIVIPRAYSYMGVKAEETVKKQQAFLKSAIDAELEKLYIEFKSR